MKDLIGCASFNNKAIQMIANSNGNAREAISLLRKSIVDVRKLVVSAGRSSKELPPVVLDVSEWLVKETIQMPYLKSMKSAFIYNKALLIETEVLREHGSLHKEVAVTMAAVLIFNLTLALHECCCRRNYRDDKVVQETVRLYSLVLRLAPSGFSRVFQLLSCAAMNNRSYLHFRLGNYALSREGLHHLSRLIRLFQKQGQRTIIDEDSEVQYGLMMNLMFLREPTLAPAA